MADLHVLRTWVFHLRSLVIVTPRYFTLFRHGTGVELIKSETCGLICFLEMTSKVLLVGLMARPDEVIHEVMVSTSCCSRALSLPVEMHL